VAAIIIGGSLLYTNRLVSELSKEEAKKVELWAAGIRSLNTNPDQDVSLVSMIMAQNETIPVILVNGNDSIISHYNVNPPQKKEKRYLRKRIVEMNEENQRIEIDLLSEKNYLYFDDSNLLKRLAWYPFVQLGAIITFILIAFWAFSYSKSAEQNQVWVGMSKETAHQLGTPISSLMAWMELIKAGTIDKVLIDEMSKDVQRLEIIAERFSKIGSKPVLKEVDLNEIVANSIEYLRKRTSARVDYSLKSDLKEELIVPLNKELFSWVIENLSKNAVDAMDGKGKLSFTIRKKNQQIMLDISDTGKGIAKNQFQNVFKPGYTSKKRGWGLGLSLAKRIIENYHQGKIYILNSEVGKGTVFRIILPQN
jgi:signal transduction histidine kinase